MCTSPVVQGAWAEGQELHVWGLCYDVADGLIHRLVGPVNSPGDVCALRLDHKPVGCGDAGAVLAAVAGCGNKRPRDDEGAEGGEGDE